MLCKTQSKTLSRAPNSYFEMVLMKAGADLDQENVIVLGKCLHIKKFMKTTNIHTYVL